MTISQLVSDIMDRLNLTSDAASKRIRRLLNTRYRRITSAIGLITVRRTRVSTVVTIGNRDVVFTGIEKVDAVISVSSGKDKTLKELTHDEMIEETLKSEPPTKYSILSETDGTVTVRLNCTPTTGFTLYADGLQDITDLSGAQSPGIPESFHDVLIYGVMVDEYRKMEKPELMQEAKFEYEMRLSDLKMFVAKSAYLDVYQGKHATRSAWWDSRKNTLG